MAVRFMSKTNTTKAKFSDDETFDTNVVMKEFLNK